MLKKMLEEIPDSKVTFLNGHEVKDVEEALKTMGITQEEYKVYTKH